MLIFARSGTGTLDDHFDLIEQFRQCAKEMKEFAGFERGLGKFALGKGAVPKIYEMMIGELDSWLISQKSA